MGIGAAFATGLVKGFTQNIQQEKARRLAEQQKIDAFEQTALQSVLTGKATKSGYDAVSKLIKSAQQQIDERPDIDIFGRATDGIDIDFASLQGTLEDATQDYVMIGSVRLDVNEKYFDPASDAQDKANIFMDSLNNKMATPALRNEFLSKFKTEDDVRALETMYRGQLGQWIRTRAFDQEGKKMINIDPSDSLPIHTPLSEFLGWGVDKEYELAREAAARKLGTGSTDIPSNYALLPVGLGGNKGSVAVPFADLGFTEPDQIAGLEGLAKFQKMDTQKFLYNYAAQFDNQVDFMKGLSHSVKLFNLNAANPKSGDDNYNVGQYLMSQPDLKDDALARAYAMTPFVVDLRSPQERTMAKIGFEAYKSLPFKEEFEKLTGQKLDAFQERSASLFKARNNLTGLLEKIDATGLKVEGVVANTFNSIYGFFGETGTIDQIKNLVVGRNGYADEISSTKIDAFMKNELKDVSNDVAAARTLAFIAAGDLARAEDPSGRLSDQDFIRNYRKLGINASGTVDNQIAAIKTVLDEVNMKYREVEVLNQIVSRGIGGNLTPGDRKLLQGDARAKSFVRLYYDSGGQVEETQAAPVLPSFESVTTNTDRYEPYSLYVGKDGGTVYRDKQTSALIITSNGAVTQQFAKGDSTRQAFTSGALVRSSAGAPGGPAPAPAPAPTGAQPTPSPQPAPATGTIEYLDVAGKESGNNQQGYTLEGYPGKYKKTTRPDGTQYFEPMK
jgi:hypothetical protein